MKIKTVKDSEQMRMLGATIGRLERNRRRYLNEKMGDLGLIGHQFFFLISLYHEPGISQEALVEILGIDKTRVARSALQLEQLGYIVRDRDPHNRRKYRLRLTEEGEKLIPRIRTVISEWGAKVTEGLNDEEIDSLFGYLMVLRKNVM